MGKSKKGLNTFGKKKSAILGKRSTKLLKTHNPSLYRGAHTGPLQAMEKAKYQEKARLRHKKELVTL